MPRPACGWRPHCPAPSHVIDQGSLDDDPSCSNAGTVPRCAVSLSAPWRAARRPEHKAVARARCRLRVLPVSWGPSVVSTCVGDISGRAAHVCIRGRQSHCRRVILEHSPAARLGARRPAVAGRAAPAAHSPHRAKWRHPGPRPQEAQPVGGRRQEAPGPARPTAGPGRSRHEAAGLLPPPSSEGVGDQPHSTEQGPAAQTGGQGTDAQPLPRGAQRARRDGGRTHLVAQLLGLLLQHGVALLVPAHVLVVAKPLHVFQLLVRNFQLLLVVVVFFNFDFKVLQLLLR